MNQLQKELSKQIKKFCDTAVEPHLEHDDENQLFRKEIYDGFASLGLSGIPVSEDFGGAGLGYTDFSYALEEVAKCSVPYAVTLSVSTMVQGIFEQFGNDQQKKKFLPALTAGKEIASFCLSESGAGSDAAALKTTAKKNEQGDYIINGSKLWISTAGISKTYIVMARTGGEGAKGISAFIVDKNTPGFSVGKKENKMGWRNSETREVLFQNCIVPKENLLSQEGDGFKIAMSALDKGRIAIGAIANGLSLRANHEAIRYALERKQFGQAIYDFQGLNWMIAENATEIEAARLLVLKAAENYDAKKPDTKLASMAKLKATDTSMKVTTDAVQILGGVGYTKEYPVERYMRDAKVLQIVEGTNQIQKVVISKLIKKEYQN